MHALQKGSILNKLLDGRASLYMCNNLWKCDLPMTPPPLVSSQLLIFLQLEVVLQVEVGVAVEVGVEMEMAMVSLVLPVWKLDSLHAVLVMRVSALWDHHRLSAPATKNAFSKRTPPVAMTSLLCLAFLVCIARHI